IDVVRFVLSLEESDDSAFRYEELEHVLSARSSPPSRAGSNATTATGRLDVDRARQNQRGVVVRAQLLVIFQRSSRWTGPLSRRSALVACPIRRAAVTLNARCRIFGYAVALPSPRPRS